MSHIGGERCPCHGWRKVPATRTKAEDLTLVRIGAHILVAKMIAVTGLTEEEIVGAVIDAARDNGRVKA